MTVKVESLNKDCLICNYTASNVKESVWDRKKTSVKSSPCEFQCDFCQSTSL